MMGSRRSASRGHLGGRWIEHPIRKQLDAVGRQYPVGEVRLAPGRSPWWGPWPPQGMAPLDRDASVLSRRHGVMRVRHVRGSQPEQRRWLGRVPNAIRRDDGLACNGWRRIADPGRRSVGSPTVDWAPSHPNVLASQAGSTVVGTLGRRAGDARNEAHAASERVGRRLVRGRSMPWHVRAESSPTCSTHPPRRPRLRRSTPRPQFANDVVGGRAPSTWHTGMDRTYLPVHTWP